MLQCLNEELCGVPRRLFLAVSLAFRLLPIRPVTNCFYDDVIHFSFMARNVEIQNISSMVSAGKRQLEFGSPLPHFKLLP